MEYKTENFIVNIVVESGRKLLEQADILAFMEAEGYLTLNGSAFETDILQDVLSNLKWHRIIDEIQQSSSWESTDTDTDTEHEEEEQEEEEEF
jgi:hypothetical protein